MKDKLYGFIYITTNNINGMKYIGQKKYTSGWKKYLGSGIYIKRAIKKHGEENFTREIIEKCKTKEEADIQEKYWIDYYDAANSSKFYNIALGGDGGWVNCGKSEEEIAAIYEKRSREYPQACGEDAMASILTEEQVLEIVKRLQNNEFNSDISLDYNVSCGTIDDIRHHRTWRHLTENIVFDDISGRKRALVKPVIQYDLDGNYIATYKSAREADKQTGIGYKLISRVCRGKRPYTHGYIFRFKHDIESEITLS